MKLTEDKIENFAISLLKSLRYEYKHGSIIAPNGDHPERENYSDVILKNRLFQAINNLNPHLPQDSKEEAYRTLTTINTSDLINNNEIFHKYLTEGIPINYQQEGINRGDNLKLIDFENPENNDFLVVNQFTIIENKEYRPDLILFINGLPLVVIELKDATNEKATTLKAFKQIKTYQQQIPSLFIYNAFSIISDGLQAEVGSLSADYNRFMKWKNLTDTPEHEKIPELETMIHGLLNKATLIDFIRHFIVFEKSKKEDPKTKTTAIPTIKKIAAYHQYYAVNKALQRVLEAIAETGDKKGGVVWHTQGSGKSLSMVFLTGKMVLATQLNNPTIVVLTDRNDLDDQLFDTFAASRQLLRQEPQKANNREQIKELLNVDSGGIIFTTVQKFSPENQETIYPELSPRSNIIVIADEAHRSQYGFKAKELDIKDKNGVIIGKRTAYGFAKYIRDALPNATFIGFTGTPIEKTDKNTPEVFGNYIDVYDIAQAVADKATVPIYYESRLVKIDLDEAGRKLLNELDDDLEGLGEGGSLQKAKARRTGLEAVIGATKRIKEIAPDIISHFELRRKVFPGKALIVAFSREIAVKLYQEIINHRPQWHHADLDKGTIKIVMTAAADDGPELVKHRTTKGERRILADRVKNPEDSLQLVIVCDMWLTGFDAPCLHTLYIDKPMKSHNLMQAIARVNRVYLDKPGGLIVDYLGIGEQLREALTFYTESGGKGQPTYYQEEAINLMLAKLEIVEQLMSNCPYNAYFTADTAQKLRIILEAEEHILGLENGKDRFNKEVTALSQAYVLAVSSPEALAIAQKVSFFQAVKARLEKFASHDEDVSNLEIESAIKQIVDQALVSEQFIDVFGAAGLKKPDISIFSDEFMAEVRELEHKNIAIELLKKLLNDEIKTRQRTNLVQSRKLAQMLENTVRKYQNRMIEAVDVIEELIYIAKEVTKADQRGEELGLEPYEVAFYDALAQNNSARDVMGIDQLRELAIVLVQRIRENASIDWNLKENVRARMKVMVKRLLRQYGYPPDMQALATELVLEQAKLFTEFTVNGWPGQPKAYH